MMRWFRSLVAFLILTTATAVFGRPVLTGADMRPAIDLDGAWTWSIDPYGTGLQNFHGDAPSPSARRYNDFDVTEAMRRDPKALYEFDMDRAPVVHLPQSFLTYSPEMRHYDGLVWNQKHFTAHALAGRRAFLRFGAVDYRARIWLNGKYVGEHEGGFTPFSFEVTKQLCDGDNRLTVGVDSKRTAGDLPPPSTDWENYGGITRPVSLILTPPTFVDDGWVRLTRNGQIAVTMKLDGPQATGASVRVVIPALGFALSGRTAADGSWSGSAPAPRILKRWSPESPTLYEVRFQSGGDILNDKVGFRTIEVRGHEILLNGKPIFLRGISIHAEEFGTDPTRAITPAAALALLTEAKTGLHANYVRLAHYPHPETMLRAADELGLLVWSEIPVYWVVDFTNAETLKTALQMQSESILRDRNRASIIIWSVGNETPVSDARNAFLRTLIANAHRLDDTRLVSAALLASRKGNIQTIDDPIAPDLDVLAANTYNGWYSPDALPTLSSIEWREPVDKPLIFSELGAGALAGYHDDPANPHKFSEEFQAEFYRQTLAEASRIPFLRGMSPWILKDFRSPNRQHPIYQQGWNRKGLESETGQRKEAFDVLASYYRSLEERH
ncbi:MAG TPA: glycoside hydrolase family 2 TIM barrel-domain containing protein [Sphingomicrobium sp.]|jgi:beta-glucuronidase